MYAVEADRLTKRYGNFHALRELSLRVPEGDVFGLLGPNGAGKTTLLRTLLGYIRPTSGRASIFGIDAAGDSIGVRSITTYLPAEAKLFRMMRGSRVIEFFSEVHPRGNLQRAREIADRLRLDASRMVAFMSTGMRQKLAIACSLGADSRLVLLDEPTANLDPNVRSEVIRLIRETRERGATVVLSSHLMDEIEELCSHAAIIREGRVVREVDLGQIRRVYRVRSDRAAAEAPMGLSLLPAAAAGPSLEPTAEASWELDTQRLSLAEAVHFFERSGISLRHIEPLGLRYIYDSCSTAGNAAGGD